MKNNKLKKRIGIISCLCASALLIGSTMALFSVTDSSSKVGTIGSVDVAISELNIDNINNINPGDNDPNLPQDPEDPRTPGTPHDLTFSVSNNGTKSIRTRHIITVKMNDETSNLSPSVFMVTDGNNEITDKYYVVNGKDIPARDFDESNGTCSAVKYIVAGDIFDGQGVSLEDGGNAEKEENSTVKGNAEDIPSKDYVYNLAMSHTASDEYQGQKVSIEVEVQGMQYRNTNNSDWQTLFTDGIVIG